MDQTLSILKLSDGNMLLNCAGISNRIYWVQATTNLISPVWTTLTTTNSDRDGLFSFIDMDATNYPVRFYRTAAPQ